MFWLVNQYLNDVYFQNYVNTSIGPYSPFIVLTIGLGGGSGFGYVLLKRRHGDQGLVGKIQKSKSFKPGSLLSTGAPVASPSRQILPTGAPPSSTSKHTAYSVPPLPRSSSPSSSRNRDRKSTRLNSSHTVISYAVFCLKKKKKKHNKKTYPKKAEDTHS